MPAKPKKVESICKVDREVVISRSFFCPWLKYFPDKKTTPKLLEVLSLESSLVLSTQLRLTAIYEAKIAGQS